jgi:pyruvate kinase
MATHAASPGAVAPEPSPDAAGLNDVRALIHDLSAVRAAMVDLEDSGRERLDDLPEAQRDSARNLLHYLALRQEDVRPLQERLAALGLSSLGRSEAHALESVDAVLRLLHRLAGDRPDGEPVPVVGGASELAAGDARLLAHTEALLGPPPPGRDCRVMVTMPAEAATDYALVRDLLASGMDCMRINCAHDDAAAWQAMVDHLSRARDEVGRPCRILMDLAGPKLRTGPLTPGPEVLKCRPTRDDAGRVLAPARIWLSAAGDGTPAGAPGPAAGVVPVPAAWLTALKPGQDVTLRDARGSRRTLRVTEVTAAGCWVECDKTVYFATGTLLTAQGSAGGGVRRARVGTLPPLERPLVLRPGDRLVVTRAKTPGGPADAGTPARIPCTLPEVFDAARPGERIWFDDGKIGGVIREAGPESLLVEITQARPGGSRLRAEKGINLPDTDLRVPALTAKDVADLPFIAAHANMVALSFVREPEAVLDLQRRLVALHSGIGIVLKIETRRGFEQLPQLLLAVMRAPSAGVMIARGDLAIEAGYERMAEVQEEVLWLAEAAHLPVIWATQVLETLAQTGQPTRAEITDAAMAERAECVMLNKGPHIVEAVRALDDILRRMQDHQSKKVALLRRLRSWPAAALGPEA